MTPDDRAKLRELAEERLSLAIQRWCRPVAALTVRGDDAARREFDDVFGPLLDALAHAEGRAVAAETAGRAHKQRADRAEAMVEEYDERRYALAEDLRAQKAISDAARALAEQWQEDAAGWIKGGDPAMLAYANCTLIDARALLDVLDAEGQPDA